MGFLIYIVGCITSLVIFKKLNTKKDYPKYNISQALFISVFSWATVLAVGLEKLGASKWYKKLNDWFRN